MFVLNLSKSSVSYENNCLFLALYAITHDLDENA